MIQQTSILTFINTVKPSLNYKQKLVLEALEDIYPATNKQIAKYLNWPINSVTPRVLELRAKQKVVEARRDFDGGRKAIFWKPKEQEWEQSDVD